MEAGAQNQLRLVKPINQMGRCMATKANLVSHRARKQLQTVVPRPMADHGLTRLADVTLRLKSENLFHRGCDPGQIADLPVA